MSIAELFSVIVACGIFMMGYNSKSYTENSTVFSLGVAYLFVGILDLVHTLGYTGMGVFSGYDPNLPTQLWIAARYLESISLFLVLLLIRKNKIGILLLPGYTIVTILLLVSIFNNWFPDCFIEGVGLTTFKKISEAIISSIFLGVLAVLQYRRREFSNDIWRLLILSISISVCSELAFTFYVHVNGLLNLIGH